MISRSIRAVVLFATTAAAATALAQDPGPTLSAQREAMGRLSSMDGEWRGSAWILTPSGEKHEITQTERVGTFLDGTIRVVEGRGYGPDGSVSFNALGILSYDPATEAFSMRSYARGHAGDYAFTPTDGGFEWEIPAGPATIRYRAEIADGRWTEVGDHVAPGAEPVRFFEMTLERLGDSDWPAGGPVPPK